MRLTLRTLIALGDNILSPDEHKELEDKLRDSSEGALLAKRIERLLNNPSSAKPPHLSANEQKRAADMRVSADLVAQYLDNIITNENVIKFESCAVSSDELLLEVAECHRILVELRTVPAAEERLPRAEILSLGSRVQTAFDENHESKKFCADSVNNLSGGTEKEVEVRQDCDVKELRDYKWILRTSDGQKSGPFDSVELQKKINSKAVHLGDEVWEFGGNEWQSINELVEPFGLTFPFVDRYQQAVSKEKVQQISILMVAASVIIAALYFLLASGAPIPGQLILAKGRELPAEKIILKFHPLFRSRNASEPPLIEEIKVNNSDGSFFVPAKLAAGQFARSGLHKVTIHLEKNDQVTQSFIPKEYAMKKSTPLKVTVEKAKPLELVVLLPSQISPPIDHKLE